MNQAEFEGHSLWSAVDELRQVLIEADQVAGQEQWQALDQMRFDQLQYTIRGMRAHRPPPEAEAYALATMDRVHSIVTGASAELGAFLIDRSEVHLINAARLVDQALEGVGRPGRPTAPEGTGPPLPGPAAPVAAAAVDPPPAGGVGEPGWPPPRSHARHAAPTPSHGPALVIGIAILVLAVAVGTFIAFGATGDSDGGAECTSLRVVTATSYQPALASVADELATGPDCVRLEVTTADGRNAETAVDKRHAHVWITDDASWLERYEAGEAEEYGEGGKGVEGKNTGLSYRRLATSPVLFASSPAMAARIQRAGGGWAGLAALVERKRPVSIVTRDPASTGDGLVALGGLGDAVWDSQGMDASALLLDAAYRKHRTASAIASTSLAANQVALVPEHLLSHHRGDRPVITAPGDRTVMMRYSWYATDVDASDPAIQSARTDLLTALTKGPSADAAREAAHLRDVHGRPPAMLYAKGTWVGRKLPKSNPVLDAHKVEHVFATWYAADRKADVLVVVDISGSMAAPAPGSGTPLIGLVRQNVKHLARKLPRAARLGVWGFGSRLVDHRDYVVVDPFRPLTPKHRSSLKKELNDLRVRDTGTGLYDTVLGAYRFAVTKARPGVNFQVMVFTDGLNQDDRRTHSVGQLRRALARAADPKATVGLTVVQVGKRSPKKLQAALRPVGGEVVTIDSADDVVATFIHLAAGCTDPQPLGVATGAGQRKARRPLATQAGERRASAIRASITHHRDSRLVWTIQPDSPLITSLE